MHFAVLDWQRYIRTYANAFGTQGKESSMQITPQEVSETLAMVSEQHLDIRTITLGMNLHMCADTDIDRMAEKVYDRMVSAAKDLVPTAQQI